MSWYDFFINSLIRDLLYAGLGFLFLFVVGVIFLIYGTLTGKWGKRK